MTIEEKIKEIQEEYFSEFNKKCPDIEKLNQLGIEFGELQNKIKNNS